MRTQELELDLIHADPAIQSRTGITDDVVKEYVRLLNAGTAFPAVVVFAEGAIHRLADGFHRLLAYREVGRKTIPAEVRNGSIDDAVDLSIDANQAHGLNRSNADKQRTVQLALDHPIIGKWSTRDVARKCGVGDTMVWEARKVRQQNVHGPRSSSELHVPSEGTCPQPVDNSVEVQTDHDPDDPCPEKTAANRLLYAVAARLVNRDPKASEDERAAWTRDMEMLCNEIDKRFFEKYENIRVLPLERIQAKLEWYGRGKLDQKVIEKYADAMRLGDFFPPCLAVYDGHVFRLADGHMRYHAMRLAGIAQMTVAVSRGDLFQTKIFAAGANSRHGRQRTEAELRRDAVALIELRPDFNNRQVARACGAPLSVVNELRPAT